MHLQVEDAALKSRANTLRTYHHVVSPPRAPLRRRPGQWRQQLSLATAIVISTISIIIIIITSYYHHYWYDN